MNNIFLQSLVGLVVLMIFSNYSNAQSYTSPNFPDSYETLEQCNSASCSAFTSDTVPLTTSYNSETGSCRFTNIETGFTGNVTGSGFRCSFSTDECLNPDSSGLCGGGDTPLCPDGSQPDDFGSCTDGQPIECDPLDPFRDPSCDDLPDEPSSCPLGTSPDVLGSGACFPDFDSSCEPFCDVSDDPDNSDNSDNSDNPDNPDNPGNPDNSGSSTTTVTNTTTNTTIINSDGSTTTTTSTSISETDDGVDDDFSFETSNSCNNPPSCSGNSSQCAVFLQNFQNSCAQQRNDDQNLEQLLDAIAAGTDAPYDVLISDDCDVAPVCSGSDEQCGVLRQIHASNCGSASDIIDAINASNPNLDPDGVVDQAVSDLDSLDVTDEALSNAQSIGDSQDSFISDLSDFSDGASDGTQLWGTDLIISDKLDGVFPDFNSCQSISFGVGDNAFVFPSPRGCQALDVFKTILAYVLYVVLLFFAIYTFTSGAKK